MPPRHDGDRLDTPLPPTPVPEGLSERILRSVRERRQAGATALAFDVAASSTGIVRLRPGRGDLEAPGGRARSFAERARHELAEYLEGLRGYFTVPVDLSTLAPFQQSVLRAARAIPFGEVRSYAWLAERIGNPRAVRAVGTALKANPITIVVPCHRVLRSDGSLGGYALGLDLKRRLLSLERETPTLVGSATTRIVCRHGCPYEQRTGEWNRIVFASLGEARRAGYRACTRCRPS